MDLIKPKNIPPNLSALLRKGLFSLVLEILTKIMSMEKNVKDKTKVTIYETNIARGQFPKKNSSKNGILKVNGKMNGPNWIVEIKDNIHAKIVQHSLINPLEKPSIIEIAIITKLMISTILLLNSIQVPALDKFNNRIYSPSSFYGKYRYRCKQQLFFALTLFQKIHYSEINYDDFI